MAQQKIGKLILLIVLIAIAIVLILTTGDCCRSDGPNGDDTPDKPDVGTPGQEVVTKPDDPQAICLPADIDALKCPTLCPETERVRELAIDEQCPSVPNWVLQEQESGDRRLCHYSLERKSFASRVERVVERDDGSELPPVFTPDELAELSRAELLVRALASGETNLDELTSDLAFDAPEGSTRDCIVLPTQPTGFTTTEGTFGRAGDVSTTYTGTGGSQVLVRVAVIDTTPTGSTMPGHGRTMNAVVDTFACSGDDAGSAAPSCAVEVVNYKGLPRKYSGNSVVKVAADEQGHFGFQSDVAAAVDQAVKIWLADRAAGGPQALVINLSLGWEPDCGGNQDLLRGALESAAEQGALILAAAGNRQAGTCAKGVTGPGFWLDQPVSTAAPTVPLLYAISAAGPGGMEMSTYRDDSHTAQAARGYEAVVMDGGVQLGPLSGTSVATAITSGTAARVWSMLLRDSQTADGAAVMAMLYTSGEAATPNPIKAEAFFDSGTGIPIAPAQRSVNPCEAVKAACNATDTCTSATCVSSEPLPAMTPSSDFTSTFASVAPKEVTPADLNVETQCQTCEGAVTTSLVGDFTGISLPNPWVIPQPGQTVCSDCGLTGGNKLNVSLKQWVENQGLQIDRTTVEIIWGGGGNNMAVRTYSAAQLPVASPVGPQVVQDQGLSPANNNNASAMIHFLFTDGSSYSEVLPIYP